MKILLVLLVAIRNGYKFYFWKVCDKKLNFKNNFMRFFDITLKVCCKNFSSTVDKWNFRSKCQYFFFRQLWQRLSAQSSSWLAHMLFSGPGCLSVFLRPEISSLPPTRNNPKIYPIAPSSPNYRWSGSFYRLHRWSNFKTTPEQNEIIGKQTRFRERRKFSTYWHLPNGDSSPL